MANLQLDDFLAPSVAPNERAVLTSFGRAQRIGQATTLAEDLRFEGISINDLRKNLNLLNEQMVPAPQ